ncbi:Lactonase, 7-bladed beta-propeller-domain-containing protein [Stachybotrys elegans]|uniref:Lactonase, 7-bladed beta-propeller-domain-containing protein n=1 Tax=Stachybotrys elegans TaxID=80388 RepID=A0A8K0WLE8_9HYPO|nr:Lactonase, 7-bladed beta-propeller-domain-containing protein [Stachybotrys elegans]
MRFPMSMAARAAALSQHPLAPSNHSSNHTADVSRLLIANTGHILLADFDGTSFTTALNYSDAGADPSWLAYDGAGRLFAVDEWGTNLRSLSLDLAANTLEPLAQAQGSSGVVHLEFNPDRTRMVGAAYGNGTIDVWNIEGGGLSLIKTIVSQPARDTTADEEPVVSHPHQSVLDPTGRYFAVNDLGTDTILVIDSADDAYDVSNLVPVQPGCGPRHGVFYPAWTAAASLPATHYMVVCELSNEVYVFALTYTEDNLIFTMAQAISTFDPNNPPANATSAAAGEIALSRNSLDLYVSNRLTADPTDGIAHYKIADGGVLSFADEYTSGGQIPRMFSLSTNDKTVFVATQNGTTGVSAFTRRCDGTIAEGPLATIPMNLFGDPVLTPGPKYIQQIA